MDDTSSPEHPRDRRATQIFRPGRGPAAPRPNAILGDAARTPRVAGPPGVRLRANGGPRLPRDRAVLIRLARLRVLSLSQLHPLVFPGLHASSLSRCLSRLEEGGWAQRWEEPRETGGRPRLVVPTATGLSWALGRLEEEAPGFVHERLLRTMLGTGRASPLVLPPGRIPASLPHLLEVNQVLVALLGTSELAVTWASSWPRPFPSGGAYGLRLPQPDGILLLAGGEGPRRLVFLEHDRGTESLVSFARAKVDRYRALASRPGLLEELTGFRRFAVVVTVTGPGPAETDARTRALTRLIRSRFAAALLHVMPYEDLLTQPELVGEVGRGVPPPRQPDAPEPLSP